MGKVRSIQSVLIVDDDRAVAAGLARGFIHAGKRALTASNGAYALRLAKEERPDLVLVDLDLGREWGLDVIDALKAAVPETELALVSGIADAKAQAAALQRGATHVFAKPILAPAILAQVEDGIDAAEPNTHPTLDDVITEHIKHELCAVRGNVSAAARSLGIQRQSLQQRLKKLTGSTPRTKRAKKSLAV